MVFKPPIFDVVAKSPFKLLQQHMLEVYSCVSLLEEFFQHTLKEDWDKSLEFLIKISESESRADKIKLSICNSLHDGIFLPVSKGQVLNLLMHQDSIANIVQDVAGLIYGRKMHFPESIHSELMNYISSSIKTCEKAESAVSDLSQVLESGFSGSVHSGTEKIITGIYKCESENDILQRHIRNSVFEIENEIQPLHAMFLYTVLKQIGSISDNARRVGTNFIILVSR